MKVGDTASLNWTEKIEPTSMLRDALGIWSDHLSIQEEFTEGITSVTTRARYYTIWAYYYEYLYKNRIIPPKNFEKIFILASLAHHNGESQSPGLLHMYNNQRFAGKWEEMKVFPLDSFDINGFGFTYYNRQMQVLKCAWTDYFNQDHTSGITKQLADTLSFLDPEYFKRESFSKQELATLFEGFSISQISENAEEQDILSKLLFGFFCENGNDWMIDEETFNAYMQGEGDFGIATPDSRSSKINGNYSYSDSNKKRRNTLLFFLKVINETNPTISRNDIYRCLWDAAYFGQNRTNKETIDFGVLEVTRKYWEIFQFNAYYVLIMEKYLENIQKIVMENIGIDRRHILDTLDEKRLFDHLTKKLDCEISDSTNLTDVILAIDNILGSSPTSLDTQLNEAECYDALFTNDREEFIAESFIFLCLLYYRFKDFDDFPEMNDDFASLNCDSVLRYISDNCDSLRILPFLSTLFETIVNRHLLTSAIRYANGTQNWIFTEEEGRLQSARDKIGVSMRDNRWYSIRSLLLDLNFVALNEESILTLTEKGQKWLKMIE